MDEEAKKVESLLLRGQAFACSCGEKKFVYVRHQDAWECVACEQLYNGADGQPIAP